MRADSQRKCIHDSYLEYEITLFTLNSRADDPYLRFPFHLSRLTLDATRKLGRHHLAFYRGCLQGMDINLAAARYLVSGLDLRLARATLTWIQQTLAIAARSHGRFSQARLPLGTLPDATGATTALPSLETFGAERDPDDFYSDNAVQGLKGFLPGNGKRTDHTGAIMTMLTKWRKLRRTG